MSIEEQHEAEAKISALEKALKDAQFELQRLRRALEIEAALEKVRERTMTMRNTTELSETSAVLFSQLKALGIHTIRTGVGIFDEPNDAMELWLTTVSDSQEVIKILDYFSLHIHPVFENILPARQKGRPYSLTTLEGNDVRQYYQSMSTYLSQAENQVYHEKEFFYSFFFPQGALNVVTSRPLTEEECTIMIQFARVFGLIYTRFIDMQKAEAQTRDALRQNSLDRVRAEIASMRNADDLEHITPLIWRELVTLGVPFFRCGIFIVDEKSQHVHSYLSTPDGRSLAVLHLPFDGAETTQNIVSNWRQKTVYKDHWDRQQFQDWVQAMASQRQISTVEQYQAGAVAPESLSLQFIPFSQGMLYVGSHEPLEENEIDLVDSLAEAFSVAYARYEDFKQLEDAKNRIEMTLSELKATQSQLIQSEKMASLGQLTAGIAHEIQNPLNFVNNFSEVNKELIDEMGEELEKGNLDDAKALAKDIKENEEKIMHHGKRADAIVKGMLQHSRASSSTKEPTDINALADEYLRLAYHGLRAKDKSFNATMKTDFDETIGMINIVPQDIGRVILNLITNAFYACTDRANGEKQSTVGSLPAAPGRLPVGQESRNEAGPQSTAGSSTSTNSGIVQSSANSERRTRLHNVSAGEEANGDYSPTVTVTTKNLGDKIEISVKDNGNGIPKHNLDKIFQPFFTTKPTGQGTGLGLSLSYDIVKAHGGELRVETEDARSPRPDDPVGRGKGAEFIITLPTNV